MSSENKFHTFYLYRTHTKPDRFSIAGSEEMNRFELLAIIYLLSSRTSDFFGGVETSIITTEECLKLVMAFVERSRNLETTPIMLVPKINSEAGSVFEEHITGSNFDENDLLYEE